MITVTRTGDPRQLARTIPAPQVVERRLNVAWAKRSRELAKEKFDGGPGARYYQRRSGDTAKLVQSRPLPGGGELTLATRAGRVLEEGTGFLPGGVIKPKRGNFLTFRLHQPGDTDRLTGRWVRVRSVRIKGKFPLRDSAREALRELPAALKEVLSDLTSGRS